MTRSLKIPGLFAFVVAGALILAGCNQSNAPTEYNALTQTNFMQGCTGNFPGSGTTIASNTFCECAYQVFVKDVPIATFDQLNNDLKTDQNKIPDNVKADLQKCPGWGLPPGQEVSTQGPVAGTTPGSAAPSSGGAGTTALK